MLILGSTSGIAKNVYKNQTYVEPFFNVML